MIPTVGNSPQGITTGPDGNLWFVEQNTMVQHGDKVAYITTAGSITEFSETNANLSYLGLYGIVAGPDGNLWFTELGSNLGQITPGGTITEFPLPINNVGTSLPIAVGPDGDFWIPYFAQVVHVAPSGAVTEFTAPAFMSESPEGIAAGQDGNMWFPDSDYKIVRITPTGIATEFPVNSPLYFGGITAGPDGNIWFTEGLDGTIANISPTGTVAEVHMPQSTFPVGITTGADGNIWFTCNDCIGRLTITK